MTTGETISKEQYYREKIEQEIIEDMIFGNIPPEEDSDE